MKQNDKDEKKRGRQASAPHEIPPLGWKDIALRVKEEMARDRVGFVAAGVAFYLFLGLIPSIGAAVAIYGLVADPADVESQLSAFQGLVPAEALDLIEGELERVASDTGTASFAAFFGILLALWGGAKAIDALIKAMNVAYDEQDRRNFIQRKLVAMAMTTGAILFAIIALSLLAAGPSILEFIGLGRFASTVISIARWPALCVAAILWLAVIYRYLPARSSPKWQWVTWGSAIATLLWIVGSLLFTLYAANFADYSKSYGSLGALILLLTWLYLSAFVVIFGAEINAEIEHQTARDSTVGEEKPMGERGAYVADTLGKRM